MPYNLEDTYVIPEETQKKQKEAKTLITKEDIKEAGYSTNPATIASRRHYAKLSLSEKRKRWKQQHRRRLEVVAAGRCYKCGKPRERAEIQHCNICHEKNLNRVKEYKIENALEGKCSKCPNKVIGNSSHCEACKAKAREYQRKKRNARRST